MAKVFAVQRPAVMRRDGWRDKYDLSAAERFGELVELLPRGNIPEDTRTARRRMEEGLQDFDFDQDYLLLLGDPVAIGVAVHILALRQEHHRGVGDGGELHALKWDGAGSYSVRTIG